MLAPQRRHWGRFGSRTLSPQQPSSSKSAIRVALLKCGLLRAQRPRAACRDRASAPYRAPEVVPLRPFSKAPHQRGSKPGFGGFWWVLAGSGSDKDVRWKVRYEDCARRTARATDRARDGPRTTDHARAHARDRTTRERPHARRTVRARERETARARETARERVASPRRARRAALSDLPS